MPMRPQTQPLLFGASAQPLRLMHLGTRQQLAHRQGFEVGMLGAERLGDPFVFLLQQAAGGVDQPATGLEEPGGAVKNGLLQQRLLGHGLWRLTPFEVWAAAQGAQAGARRIDQHPVNLAGQALDAVVALVRNRHRMHIGQTAAGQV